MCSAQCGNKATESSSKSRSSLQTRYIASMLAQCWDSVEDGGPTLSQHRVNVSCLLGCITTIHFSTIIYMYTQNCTRHDSEWFGALYIHKMQDTNILQTSSEIRTQHVRITSYSRAERAIDISQSALYVPPGDVSMLGQRRR